MLLQQLLLLPLRVRWLLLLWLLLLLLAVLLLMQLPVARELRELVAGGLRVQ